MDDSFYSYLYDRNVARRNALNRRIHHHYMYSAARRVAEAVRHDLRRRGRTWQEDDYGNIQKIYFPRGGKAKAAYPAFKYPYVPLYKPGVRGRLGWAFERDRERWKYRVRQAIENFKRKRVRAIRWD